LKRAIGLACFVELETMKRLIATLMLTAPAAAFAQGELSLDVDAFVGASFAEVESEPDRQNLNGLDTGIRGTVRHDTGVFAFAEYTYGDLSDRVEGTKLNLELHEYRLGGGYRAPINSRLNAGLFAAFVNQELQARFGGVQTTTEREGFNVGAVVDFQATPLINTYGRFGYLEVDGNNPAGGFGGVDLNAGFTYEWAKGLAGFIEYRYTNLEGRGSDLIYNAVRAGMRFSY
jgi:hypothetical protein